jgi:hypothetical protein
VNFSLDVNRFLNYSLHKKIHNKKIEIDKSLEAWMELMRGFSESMQVDLFMASKGQVRYT